MVYTPEKKKRMERLLEVFSDYVAESQYLGIAYADKTGISNRDLSFTYCRGGS